MIFQSSETADYLLPDKTFWRRMLEPDLTEISGKYKILCPTILYAEIYEGEGYDKLLECKIEAIYIDPWIILVKNELEGNSIFQNDNTKPINLKKVSDMNEEEKYIIEVTKKMIEALDKSTRSLASKPPKFNNSLASFANSPHQDLTWIQFINRFKECTQGTVFESIGKIAEDPKYDRKRVRTEIEDFLSQYANQFPIDTFEKAFALAQYLVKEYFSRICNEIFILHLENCPLGFERTHWEKVQNELKFYNINNLFPYTLYALQLFISFRLFRYGKQYNKEIEATDVEYLYYLYFSDVLFVSTDQQHETYINETGILNSRCNGSFAYIPQKEKSQEDQEEHDKVMFYIKNKSLH